MSTELPPLPVQPEPVAYGFPNTAITGRNRWMMLREEVPADDQYGGAMWVPLYAAPSQPREPVRLTDDALHAMVRATAESDAPIWPRLVELVRAVEDAVLRAQGIDT